jgi:dynein heavy chain
MFGMHPNAEINYLTALGETLFTTIIDVKGGAGAGAGTKKKEDIVMEMVVFFLSKLPEPFVMIDINAKAKEKTPDVVVCLQECERMNVLLDEIRRSLVELQLGLTGALSTTEKMDEFMVALSVNRVPGNWTEVAYFSKKALAAWFSDLLLSLVRELDKAQVSVGFRPVQPYVVPDLCDADHSSSEELAA